MAAKRPSLDTHSFTGRVEVISLGVPFHAVLLPAKVSAAFGPGRAFVAGTVNGAPLRTSLSPRKGGGHYVFLNKRVRELAELKPGARVTVTLQRDSSPREDPLPDDVTLALREAGALDAFLRVARSTRNALVQWVEDARAETTRDKRIARIVERGLLAREKEMDREIAPPAKSGNRRRSSAKG